MDLFQSQGYEVPAVKVMEIYLGIPVSRVTAALFNHSPATLAHLCDKTKLPPKKVKEAVTTLFKHNIVQYKSIPPRKPEVELSKKNVLYFLRRSRYIMYARKKCSFEAELLIEKLLELGKCPLSELLISLCCKQAASSILSGASFPSDKLVKLKDELQALVSKKFIIRTPCAAVRQTLKESTTIPELSDDELHRYPEALIDLQLIKREVESRVCSSETASQLYAPKRLSSSLPDSQICWTINYDAFHLNWRDDLVIELVSKSVGEGVKPIVTSLITAAYGPLHDKWINGAYVTSEHVKRLLPQHSNIDYCMPALEDASLAFIHKVGTGEYCLDFAAFIERVTREVVTRRICHRFGQKAARIFRLVLEKTMTNSEFIASESLMDKRESESLTYLLISNYYLKIHDIRKPSMNKRDAKDFIFLTCSFPKVVDLTAQQIFKSIYNLLKARERLYSDNQCLLQKKARLDVITQKLSAYKADPEKTGEVAALTEDLEDLISAAEQAALDKFESNVAKIIINIDGLTEDLFLLELYMKYYPYMEDLSCGRRSHYHGYRHQTNDC